MSRRIDEWNERARKIKSVRGDRAKETWAPGWPQRLQGRVRDLGFGSLLELLEVHPGESYIRLSEGVLSGFAPKQIVREQMREAMGKGRLRDAAADALVRAFDRNLGAGWLTGNDPRSGLASSFAQWIAMLRFDAGAPELEPVATKVFDALEELKPPHGWRPNDARDGLIRQAFDAGWPE